MPAAALIALIPSLAKTALAGYLAFRDFVRENAGNDDALQAIVDAAHAEGRLADISDLIAGDAAMDAARARLLQKIAEKKSAALPQADG